jgi:hypothetical protein
VLDTGETAAKKASIDANLGGDGGEEVVAEDANAEMAAMMGFSGFGGGN